MDEWIEQSYSLVMVQEHHKEMRFREKWQLWVTKSQNHLLGHSGLSKLQHRLDISDLWFLQRSLLESVPGSPG